MHWASVQLHLHRFGNIFKPNQDNKKCVYINKYIYIYIYIYLGGGGINWLTLSKKKKEKMKCVSISVYGILILVTFNESTKILISVK